MANTQSDTSQAEATPSDQGDQLVYTTQSDVADYQEPQSAHEESQQDEHGSNDAKKHHINPRLCIAIAAGAALIAAGIACGLHFARKSQSTSFLPISLLKR
ncbi:hypothetical protein D2E26_0957 [Bifidobacterium dolichotidis]|uniref:Uncharacterized protein n=1 Tax=Bifidobacterium dolichotidis TaxID=2306976 RepID=A0A430FPZ3_9BIFI|nr:hypothetical protein [Bifidobacterium dolichotidis]RSX54903.1 hypothetical protein D2E26_0957 [Bifidobacterium dolichotidis]